MATWLKPFGMLRRVERFPQRVVAGVFAVIALGIGTLPLFSGEFIPALREGHYIVHMSAVPGGRIRIAAHRQRVSQALLEIEGVQSVAQWFDACPTAPYVRYPLQRIRGGDRPATGQSAAAHSA